MAATSQVQGAQRTTEHCSSSTHREAPPTHRSPQTQACAPTAPSPRPSWSATARRTRGSSWRPWDRSPSRSRSAPACPPAPGLHASTSASNYCFRTSWQAPDESAACACTRRADCAATAIRTAIAPGAAMPHVHQQRGRLLCGRHARSNARSAPAEPPDRSGRSFVDARRSSSAFLLITSAPVTHAPYTVPWPDAGVVMWRKYHENADAERSQMNG